MRITVRIRSVAAVVSTLIVLTAPANVPAKEEGHAPEGPLVRVGEVEGKLFCDDRLACDARGKTFITSTGTGKRDGSN